MADHPGGDRIRRPGSGGSTGPRDYVSRLAGDPWLWAAAVLFLVVETIYLAPGVAEEVRVLTTRRLAPIAVLGLAAIVLARGLGSLASKRERRLWRSFAVGLWIWVGVMLLLLSAWWHRPLWVDVVADVGYGGVYLAFILGIEAAPHRSRGLLPGGLTIPGATVAVTGLVLYFALLPASVDRTTYTTMVPSMFLVLALDSFLVARVGSFFFETDVPRWRIVYGSLLAAVAAVFVSDLLECLDYAGLLALGEGTPLDGLWLVPPLLFVFAARLRHVAPGVAESSRPPETESAPAFGGTLVVLAALFPLLHFVGYQWGLLDPSSREPREALVVAWIVLLGGLAYLEQWRLGGRSRLLAARGNRAVRALRRKERMLRLVLQQQRAEEDQRLSEEKFRRVFRWSPDPMVLTVQPEGRVIEANSGFESLLGRPRHEILGRTVRDLGIWRSTEDRVRFLEQLDRAGAVRDYPLQVTSPDGAVRSMLVSAEMLELGGESCLLTVARDMTERQELERQLWRSQRLETIGSLAGGVAHDLNNILSPIVLALQLLERQTLDEQGRWIVEQLEASAKRGSEMVRQILTFARGSDGALREVVLAEVVDELVAILGATFPKSIRVTTVIPEDLPALRADPTQLHQVLLNLCVNARDAMPRGGALTIRARHLAPERRFRRLHPHLTGEPLVRIDVEDEGEGIAEAVLDQIFDPFFTTKEPGRGSGLGLATVAGIVRGHGGAIDVESQAGHGTRFSVYFPAVRVDEETAATAGREAHDTWGDDRRVLVVDDEQVMREIASRILEANGYRVRTAASGEEALARLADSDGPPDVVLMDVMMPDGDGIETLFAIRRRAPGLPVVLTSGLVDAETLDDLVDEPPDEYLAKPFGAPELLAALQRVLWRAVSVGPAVDPGSGAD